MGYGDSGLFDPDLDEDERDELRRQQQLQEQSRAQQYGSKCNAHRTMGLLGTFDGRLENDLTTPECQEIGYREDFSASFQNDIYNNFGNKCT